MIQSLILLTLAGGVPYFIFLEKKGFDSRKIFLIAYMFFALAVLYEFFAMVKIERSLVLIALLSALWAAYKAAKTTNFYKLSCYLIFVNAPLFLTFMQNSTLYGVSLLLSLFGIYLIAEFYEKRYASANYLAIGGITLSTPYIGIFITIYLVSIALYPPFPNAILFTDNLLNGALDTLDYFVVCITFFSLFYLCMTALQKALFGSRNQNIYYEELGVKERAVHLTIVALMIILSAYGLKEMLL